MAMPNIQRYPASSDQFWIIYLCFVSSNCLFLFAVSLLKLLAHFLLVSSNGDLRTSGKQKLFESENDGIFHIFDHINVSRVPL